MPEDNSLSDITTNIDTLVVPEPVVVVPEVAVVPNKIYYPHHQLGTLLTSTEQDFVKIPNPESVVNYNKYGEISNDPNDAIVAKQVTSGGSSIFKLAFFGSSLYNPIGPFSTREKAIKNSFKYLVVSEDDFKLFLTFLETKNLNTYHTINRKVLNNV